MRRLGTFTIGSWVTCFCCYLLFAGKVDPSEAGAAAVAATVSVFLIRLLREKFKRPLLVRLVWLPLLWRIPAAMFIESWQLLVALVQQLRGRGGEGCFIEHDFPGPQDEHDSARRAFMTFGVCVTPNSYLVRVDREKRRVLVRQLVGKEISEVDRLFVELP